MTKTGGLFPTGGTGIVTLIWATVVAIAVVVVKVTMGLWNTVRRNRKLAREFPVPPGSHWLLGHMVLLGDEGRGLMTKSMEWSAVYKYAHVIHMGPFLQHCTVYHPDYVKAVMSRADKKDDYVYGFLRPWLGDGLLTTAGAKWFRNRRLLTPGFHFEILKPYVRLFSESTNVMMTNWEQLESGCTIDVFHHMSLMTLDSMLKCALSQHTDCQTRKTNDYIAAVYELSDLTMRRGRSLILRSDLIYALSSDGRRYRKACKLVHEYAERIIAERQETLKQRGTDEKTTKDKKYLDFLDILLKARDEDGNGLTDAEIRDEVDTFMFEGHDTTASGLSWTLYCLARQPGHQEKCRNEAREVLQGKTEVTWDLLPSLKYITMCVKESLRLFPPVPMIFRHLESPLTFPDGKTLPEGSRVGISPNTLHHNPHVWENPNEFDPLRFSSENSKERHPFAFVPFAAGPRKTNDYISSIHELAELATQRGRSLVYLLSDFVYGLSASGKRHKAACQRVHQHSEQIIRQRKDVLEGQSAGDSTHDKKYLDFLDILLRAKDEDGNGLTDAEIRDEVDTFMFEGHDTTASGLSWTLYCLARHPGHQEKCRNEAQEVLQGKTEVTWDDLPSMKYITMCVKESLRMYPAVPEILREVETPLNFPDGRTLPEGSQVYIGLYHLHHNPHIWERPDEYDPLRFSPESSKDRHPYAFLPFSAGPRNCIGQHFAMNELKTAVALILQRFSLTPDDTLPEPFHVTRLVLRAEHPGLFLKIKPV
ncbi:PREDICTED: phylloquinone omega-hydroxylase CYP4F2-like [Branchiostoma belcheri]|uniref:Phylloquinone omega-hydroxylase CYP4F2-like n=1 Tax=Branchiostoma belcheri TaxID=7741 RepID=A0A6P5AE41_BRABE|nr:PREDICTED: phylloquinone omega-hydroxylase CYP4F2-like [Branchiostoma belcheri]